MAEKIGGGKKLEEYDVNTGKYVTDGQPNKYYDNPEEKGINNFTKSPVRDEIRLNNLNFQHEFELVTDEEYEKELSELQKSIDSFDIDVDYMTQEELLIEIDMHKKFFVEKGINLIGFDNGSFGGDFRLKCVNFRQLHKLIDKYPIDLNGFEIHWGGELFWENGRAIACTTNSVSNDDILFGDTLFLNPAFFSGYESVIEKKRDQQLKKHTMTVLDEKQVLATDWITHEYGHLLFYKFLEQTIESKYGKKKWLDDARKKFENDFAYNNEIAEKYNNQYGKYGLYFYIKDQNSILLEKEANKLYNEILRKVVYDKFVGEVEKNVGWDYDGDIYQLARKNYQNELSKYANTSLDEEFAELFASIEGGKPTSSAKNLFTWLKENKLVKE